MTAPLASYGNTEGPLGFPMSDKQARVLDTLLKALPRSKEHEYRHRITTRALTELNPGERSDVSWITTESVDRQGEVVLARGMNDSQFQHNPLVTLGHAYYLPPVGKSLWRKHVKDGPAGRPGIKAKTIYPPRPDSWPIADPWPPDKVFALVQSGMLAGKSIGFLPTRVHIPDEKEARKHGWGESVGLVIDEWLLLEYACVFLPANQDALVEAVAKGTVELPPGFLTALGLDAGLLRPCATGATTGTIPFTPQEEIERHIERRLADIDFATLAKKALEEGWYKARGGV
jgi:hypothetical protein